MAHLLKYFWITYFYSIGFAIAHRLAKDGAKVVVSSRKANNVKKAVEVLRNEKLECHGMVCHVGKSEDRKKLIEEVDFLINCWVYFMKFIWNLLRIDSFKIWWDWLFSIKCCC